MKGFWLTLLFGCSICSQSIAEINSASTIGASVVFTNDYSFHLIIQSFFYGVLATFIICNLVFFIASRDKDQLYLIIALTSLGLHHLLAIDLHLWRQQQYPWLTNLLPSLLICSSIAWLSFTKHLYEIFIGRQTEFFIKAGSLLAVGLIFILPLIPINVATLIATSILLTAFGTTIYLSFKSWQRHNNSAVYILAATICLFVGSSLNLSIIQSPLNIEYGIITTIKLLTTLAALLITISLAVRSHQILILKNSFSDITRKMISETGTHFDQQLAQRTQVLTNNQDSLIQQIHQNKSSLEDTLEQLKASNQLKDDFLNKISHEFKTPLNGIQGSLQLTKQTTLDDEQKNYVLSALSSSQKLSHLIDDVLDLSQLNTGQLKLESQPFSLITTITQACAAFRKQAIDKGLQFELMLSPKIPKVVKGDQHRFSQIIEKLVSNAVKFTDRGQIKITANVLESYGNNVALIVRVNDTGIGIPKEMQEGIFESFRQVERFFSRQYEGTGVGLAISYYLVKQMGGNISVESTPNNGSTFQFTVNLPVVEKKNSSPMNLLREIKKQRCLQGKLLVVEDNKVNQMVMLGLLKKMGLNVDVADNGKIALQMLAIKHYDLILMDCQMPVMNGFEATQAIRQTEGKVSHIPIIAVTANAQASDKIACIEVGMSDFLPKPIKADALYDKLSEWLFQDNPDLSIDLSIPPKYSPNHSSP
ncbi:MAG: response regulator [Pseudomonadales bacterium]|nr:response regulator [Pseudomonadales bacterium]